MLKLQVLNVNSGVFKDSESGESFKFANLFGYDPASSYDDKNTHSSMDGFFGVEPVKFKVSDAAVVTSFTGVGLYDCSFVMGKKSGSPTPIITGMKKISSLSS